MARIEYTPLAVRDLKEISTYIAVELHQPKAANDLMGLIKSRIEYLQRFPFAFSLHISPEPLIDEFRRMPVKNYLVFYVVHDAIVEIRRVLYAGRNIERFLDDPAPE